MAPVEFSEDDLSLEATIARLRRLPPEKFAEAAAAVWAISAGHDVLDQLLETCSEVIQRTSEEFLELLEKELGSPLAPEHPDGPPNVAP